MSTETKTYLDPEPNMNTVYYVGGYKVRLEDDSEWTEKDREDRLNNILNLLKSSATKC